MRYPMRHLAALAVLLLASLGSGCASLVEDTIDPIYPVDGTMIVVPFKDQDFGTLESPRGTDIAVRVAKVLKGHEGEEDWKLKDPSELIDLYEATANEKNPRDMTPADIAEKIKVDYVVMGEIRHWQLRDPGSVNLLRGTTTVDITIYESPRLTQKKKREDGEEDAQKPKRARAVASASVSAVFPNEYGMGDIGEGDFGTPGGEVRIDNGLKASIARKIAQLFYGHSKEEERLTGTDF